MMSVIVIRSHNGTEIHRFDCNSLKEAVENAVVRGVSLANADLTHADLSHTNLRGADLVGARLLRANLHRADLINADLFNANLRGANLTHTSLWAANLNEADLSEANLRYATLFKASLRDANLRGTIFSEADLRGVEIKPELITPLYMLFDQPGPIRAYKLVKENGQGPFHGGIIYEIGKSYEVPSADTDIYEDCGAGINLATLDWCLWEYKPGYRVLIAEFTAADIAAIPIASDGKFRVHRASIIGEVDLKGRDLID